MRALAPASVLLAVLWAGTSRGKNDTTSCTACHGDAGQVGVDMVRIVQNFEADVHAQVGLSCHDCHGGNPAEAVATDKHAAKDPDRADGPYLGAPERAAVPGFCGRCHSSPEYMKRFRPDARVDQEREYWTSRHGALLREGDENVATCTDCHGVHGILRPSDPRSSVYPTHVAETCRGCHADSERMAGYTLEDGRPMPVDQYDRWARSVHAAALIEREDLSAPTCNDCHGNHGATPPGLQSIGFVCGQCHGREADLFRSSAKRGDFEAHNEFLAAADDAGEAPCASCHESEPAGQVKGVHHFGECTTCHGNHAVIRPTMAMLGPLPDTPCKFCHEPSQPDEDLIDEPSVEARFEQRRDALLAIAQRDGLQGDALFDWLVAQTPLQHIAAVPAAEGGSAALKPEFRRLFDKFRIGATHFTYRNPVTGEPVEESIIRCTSCHGATTSGDHGETTAAASAVFLDQIRRLTTRIARTERMLLRARRGGVAIGNAAASLDHAVDAQIQLEVLVHSFSTDKGSPFSQTAAEGLQHVQAASQMGVVALEELEFRRKGLATSLGIILLVLIGLGFKIREVSRRRAHGADDTDSAL
jgi:hypothetical protein